MEKIIDINGKQIKIKEMNYLDSISAPDIDRKEWFKNLLKISIVEPEPTDEFLKNLSFKEGNIIIKEINKLNGLTEDFQTPSLEELKKK